MRGWKDGFELWRKAYGLYDGLETHAKRPINPKKFKQTLSWGKRAFEELEREKPSEKAMRTLRVS